MADPDEVEPLYSALRPAGRSRLAWKILWAALVLLALVAVVLNQAF